MGCACNPRTRLAYDAGRGSGETVTDLGPTCERPMAPLSALLGLGLAAYIVLYLPAWAALCIALGAVLLVTIGGGALLAKTMVLCALILLAGRRFMRRRER